MRLISMMMISWRLGESVSEQTAGRNGKTTTSTRRDLSFNLVFQRECHQEPFLWSVVATKEEGHRPHVLVVTDTQDVQEKQVQDRNSDVAPADESSCDLRQKLFWKKLNFNRTVFHRTVKNWGTQTNVSYLWLTVWSLRITSANCSH